MANESLKQERGTPMNPSERGSDTIDPQRNGDEKEAPKEGDYRNVESVESPSSYDDDYEINQENEINREDAKSENENDIPGKRRADQA